MLIIVNPFFFERIFARKVQKSLETHPRVGQHVFQNRKVYPETCRSGGNLHVLCKVEIDLLFSHERSVGEVHIYMYWYISAWIGPVFEGHDMNFVILVGPDFSLFVSSQPHFVLF